MQSMKLVFVLRRRSGGWQSDFHTATATADAVIGQFPDLCFCEQGTFSVCDDGYLFSLWVGGLNVENIRTFNSALCTRFQREGLSDPLESLFASETASLPASATNPGKARRKAWWQFWNR
jgi:hypothetical protein